MVADCGATAVPFCYQEEKAILNRMKEMMLKVDSTHGGRYRRDMPDTDQMHTIMSRSLTKMAAFLGKVSKGMPMNQRSSSQKNISSQRSALSDVPRTKSSVASLI